MKIGRENKINLFVEFQRPCMFQAGELEQHNTHCWLLRASAMLLSICHFMLQKLLYIGNVFPEALGHII